MQPKLWKMTPNNRLPPQISCWSPPGPITINRFGPAKFSWRMEPHPPLPNDSFQPEIEDSEMQEYVDSEAESAQASRREVMLVHNVYGDVQEYERELARERNAKTTRTEIDELAIPIQPRKHLITQPQPLTRPIDPVSLDFNSKSWTTAYQRPYQQVFNQPSSILQNSHVVSLQDQASTRYHLRSQSANPALTQPRSEAFGAYVTSLQEEEEADKAVPELKLKKLV